MTTTLLAGPALAVVATATPAAAVTATHVVGADGKPWIAGPGYRTQPGVPVYGDTLSLSINVVTDSGEQVYDGTLTVERQLAGQTTWTTVATSSSAYLYDSITAKGNAIYRVTYSGSGDYSPSSDAVAARIQRKLGISVKEGRSIIVTIKVSPKYRGAITVLKKQGKQWKKFKSVRTNAKSRATFTLPAPRRGKFYWKFTIRSSKAFAATQSPTYYTYKY
ncbi:hypothetical protein [Nocardioides sp. T2.26MG-1]|uniref:hypothetical protein n=1 Tax=Nocardioides sp. T2.26MG-1 TaxID=3041166 RepID=UPI002541C047|nr:hypothetical protein [Nocardioides sp. T2.26MG-1]